MCLEDQRLKQALVIASKSPHLEVFTACLIGYTRRTGYQEKGHSLTSLRILEKANQIEIIHKVHVFKVIIVSK